GFFDHVAPPAAPIPDADRVAGNTDGLRGFRTPMLLISPLARRGYTSHMLFDHTSILQMIEWRWNLPPLTNRDRTANNLAHELDFQNTNLAAPSYTVPLVTAPACPAPTPTPPVIQSRRMREHWSRLADIARRHDWPV